MGPPSGAPFCDVFANPALGTLKPFVPMQTRVPKWAPQEILDKGSKVEYMGLHTPPAISPAMFRADHWRVTSALQAPKPAFAAAAPSAEDTKECEEKSPRPNDNWKRPRALTRGVNAWFALLSDPHSKGNQSTSSSSSSSSVEEVVFKVHYLSPLGARRSTNKHALVRDIDEPLDPSSSSSSGDEQKGEDASAATETKQAPDDGGRGASLKLSAALLVRLAAICVGESSTPRWKPAIRPPALGAVEPNGADSWWADLLRGAIRFFMSQRAATLAQLKSANPGQIRVIDAHACQFDGFGAMFRVYAARVTPAAAGSCGRRQLFPCLAAFEKATDTEQPLA